MIGTLLTIIVTWPARTWIFDVRWGAALGAAAILLAWAVVLGLLSAPRRR